MMKFFFASILCFLICQYFLVRIHIDARPTKVKNFSWTFPIHNEHDDDTTQDLVKRKGTNKIGWGKRSDYLIDDHPEHAARVWFDEK